MEVTTSPTLAVILTDHRTGTHHTPNLSAYTTAFAYNDYNVAAAQAVLIALAAFILSFTFLRFTNRKSS